MVKIDLTALIVELIQAYGRISKSTLTRGKVSKKDTKKLEQVALKLEKHYGLIASKIIDAE